MFLCDLWPSKKNITRNCISFFTNNGWKQLQMYSKDVSATIHPLSDRLIKELKPLYHEVFVYKKIRPLVELPYQAPNNCIRQLTFLFQDHWRLHKNVYIFCTKKFSCFRTELYPSFICVKNSCGINHYVFYSFYL